MDKKEAFRKLHISFQEGGAGSAALFLGYALAIQLGGWAAVTPFASKKTAIMRAFTGAGVNPHEIEFHPGGAAATAKIGQTLTQLEIRQLRVELAREFSLWAVDRRGQLYKKGEQPEKHNRKSTKYDRDGADHLQSKPTK